MQTIPYKHHSLCTSLKHDSFFMTSAVCSSSPFSSIAQPSFDASSLPASHTAPSPLLPHAYPLLLVYVSSRAVIRIYHLFGVEWRCQAHLSFLLLLIFHLLLFRLHCSSSFPLLKAFRISRLPGLDPECRFWRVPVLA